MDRRDKILVYKDYKLEGSFKDSVDNKLFYLFKNTYIEKGRNTNPKKIVLLDKEAINDLVSVLKNSTFDVKYGAHWNHDKLPTSAELTSAYFGGVGIPAQNVLTGAHVTLGTGTGQTQLKDLEGFLIDTNTGLMEVAGKVGSKIQIDSSKNNIVTEIANIISRLNTIDVSLNAIKALQTQHSSDIKALETQQQINTVDLSHMKPEIVDIIQALRALNDSKEDKSDFLHSQALQDNAIEILREDVDKNSNSLDLVDNIDATGHPLVGTSTESKYNIGSHPGDKAAFTPTKGKNYVIYIKDPAHKSGASTTLYVDGTPQVISLAHGGGSSETISVELGDNGDLVVKRVAGSIDVSTLYVDMIIEPPKGGGGGGVTPAEFSALKLKVANNKTKIDKNIVDLGHKQDSTDQAIANPTTKSVVGAINDNYNVLNGTQAPGSGNPFMNLTGDNAAWNDAGKAALKKALFTEGADKLVSNELGDSSQYAFIGKGTKINFGIGTNAIGKMYFAGGASGDQSYGEGATGKQWYGKDATGGVELGSAKGDQTKNKLVAGTKEATIEEIINKAKEPKAKTWVPGHWKDITSSYQSKTWTKDDIGKKIIVTTDVNNVYLSGILSGKTHGGGSVGVISLGEGNRDKLWYTLWNSEYSEINAKNKISYIEYMTGSSPMKNNFYKNHYTIKKFEIWVDGDFV